VIELGVDGLERGDLAVLVEPGGLAALLEAADGVARERARLAEIVGDRVLAAPLDGRLADREDRQARRPIVRGLVATELLRRSDRRVAGARAARAVLGDRDRLPVATSTASNRPYAVNRSLRVRARRLSSCARSVVR